MAIVLLAAASLAGQVSKFFLHHDHLLGLVALFNLDEEGNVPTWFSSVQLLVCSALLALVGFESRQAGRRYVRHWLTLSAIFLYMSIDEAAVIHELLNGPVRSLLPPLPGFLSYAWVLVGGLAVFGVGLAYLPFVWALQPPTRWLFILAGAVYVGGALFFDLPEGAYAARYGTEHFAYALLTTVEEVLEMTGLTLFIYALLDYQATAFGVVRLRVTNGRTPADQRNSARPADQRIPHDSSANAA